MTDDPFNDEIFKALFPEIGPDEIPDRTWEKIKKYLAENHSIITYQSLAEFLGVTPQWVREKRMLDVIAMHLPDEWAIDKISPAVNRPKRLLVPDSDRNI